MKCISHPTLLAALLVAAMTLPPASAADPLGLIAPGLTADKLCPLVKSNPKAAIDAIATGAARAYDQGPQAQSDFAGAMAAAVMAANDNQCIDEVFEVVNRAIINGGYKVEYVTGKALALGVAQGTASVAGEVLAKATAVVICRGGASARACAKAWNQAIKIDPVNGCAVLVQAYVHATAYCSAGKAATNVQTTLFKQLLGDCNAPGLYDNGGNSASTQAPVVVFQGPFGQKLVYPDGTEVVQGPGVQTTVYSGKGGWVGPFGLHFGWTKVDQGKDGQQITFGGRKLLTA